MNEQDRQKSIEDLLKEIDRLKCLVEYDKELFEYYSAAAEDSPEEYAEDFSNAKFDYEWSLKNLEIATDKLNEMKSLPRAELTHEEWREAPAWYCVKTDFDLQTGKTESEIVTDEKSKIPILIHQTEKPLDSSYETTSRIVYYTYHETYESAQKLLA